MTAQRPDYWEIQARYALRQTDTPLELPAGSWLLPLPEMADGRDHPLHYRLADGRIVCLDTPLTDEQAIPLTDPQALTALTAYRSLEQAVAEEWGLQVEQVDQTPPFRIIQCPLCDGTQFVTVGFAAVWCDRCQAQFQVRGTAGDPGFVVDCTWEHLAYGPSRYLLPRSDDLLLTMVFKNSGDPLTVRHDRYCHRTDCTPEQVARTDDADGPLRAGLHACALGDVYDWSFYGRTPTVYNETRHRTYSLVWPDGRQEIWPQRAFVPVSGLSQEERRQVSGAAALLQREGSAGHYRDALVVFLQEWAQRPSRAPYQYRTPWPHKGRLAAEEKYLLHRWLVTPEKSGAVTAVPVWLVVRPLPDSPGVRRWQVVRDDLCPQCGEPATPAEMTQPVDGRRPWATPHGSCRALWSAHNWQPTLYGADQAQV
jgi:hypothetical protein